MLSSRFLDVKTATYEFIHRLPWLQRRPIWRHDSLVILVVFADTGEIGDDGDVQSVEKLLFSDAGSFENLGGSEGAAGDDDHSFRFYGFEGGFRFGCSLRAGLVL